MTTLPQLLTDIEIERTLALVEKGQQLAGHFPSAQTMDRARRYLTGELSREDAEAELADALARIVEKEQAQLRGS